MAFNSRVPASEVSRLPRAGRMPFTGQPSELRRGVSSSEPRLGRTPFTGQPLDGHHNELDPSVTGIAGSASILWGRKCL